MTVAQASVVSSKPNVNLDLHAKTCVVGNNCLALSGHNKPFDVFSNASKGSHKCARTVDAALCYDHQHSENKFILLINQTIQIRGLTNYLLCPMQIEEVTKFLADSPRETAHAIKIAEFLEAVHMFTFPLHYKVLPIILI